MNQNSNDSQSEGHKPEYHVLISDIPEGERPRERFKQLGAGAMSQRELLAILLRTGARGIGALALADKLLKDFDGLSGLTRSDIHELQQVSGIGPVKAIEIQAALELGKRMMLSAPDQQRSQIKTPADAAQLLMLEMGILEQEEVRTLLLDTRNKVISLVVIYRGSLNAASMRIAEVFRPAIRANALSIIVTHNHPSGDPAPSAEDVKVTRDLVKSGKLLGIDVLDHIIIAQHHYVSMKERGLGFEE